jgi:hypothetical protein
MVAESTEDVAAALGAVQTDSGANLLALVEASPVLLIFLRHFGCSFCRKTISDVAELRAEMEKRGVRPVFVHMGTPATAKATFEYYGMGDVERVHDPEAALYRHPVFGLGRTGMVSQVAKWNVLARMFGGSVKKYGVGKIEGDGQQMPGIFFLRGPQIVRKFVHRTIADEPDYLKLIA